VSGLARGQRTGFNYDTGREETHSLAEWKEMERGLADSWRIRIAGDLLVMGRNTRGDGEVKFEIHDY
jgi:hypothetical protein